MARWLTLGRIIGAALALLAALAAAPPAAASAGDPASPFTEEADTSAEGTAELIAVSTVFAGREQYYGRLEPRLELSLGLAPKLEGTFGWDAGTMTEDVPAESEDGPKRETSFQFESVYAALRYKFSDAVADKLGSAVAAGAAYGPSLARAGLRLILDKQLGNLRFVVNVTGEQNWDLSRPSSRSSQLAMLGLAGGYYLTPILFAGVEALSESRIEDEELVSSSIYAGPTLSVYADRYYLLLGASPQVFAPKSDEGSLDLENGEHLRARILIGLRL